MTSQWDGRRLERDLESLDPSRLLAIRRLLQLLDVVVASRDLREEHYYPVRRAWQCIGANLLEHSIPADLKERLVAHDGEDLPALRLRLHFASDTDLARYPWEYLTGDFSVSEDRPEPPLPLALTSGLLIQRVTSTPGGRDESGQERPRAARGAAPGKVAFGSPPLTDPVPRVGAGGRSTQPPPGVSGLHVAEPAPHGHQEPGDEAPRILSTTVGLVNALPARFYGLGQRLARELEHLPSTDMVFELGEQAERADWPTFSDSMDQQPSHLVLLLPTLRRGSHELKLGFGPRADAPDWRSVSDLEMLLKPRAELQLLILGTMASAPSVDAFRGNIEVAEELSRRLTRPVVFLCHTPGYERFVDVFPADDPRPGTFTGLLLHALSLGKGTEESFVYARDRVVHNMNERFRPLFGVPGFYLPGTLESEGQT